MTANTKNLNNELYSNELFEVWVKKQGLIPAEEWLIKKYLTDTSKHVLEAGTGGGRISFQIEQMGFKHISAFDFVPKMIEYANLVAKQSGSTIQFKTLDAANLADYEDNTFDYLIYLQQVLCFIDKEAMFLDALNEAYRIAKKESVIIFSFLDFDARSFSSIICLVVNALRKIRKEEISKQYLPWLRVKNKCNWKLFNRNQPLLYWVKKEQILSMLKTIGFTVVETIHENQLHQFSKKGKGMLYIVCSKKN